MIRWFWGVLSGFGALILLCLYIADRYGEGAGIAVGFAIGGVLCLLLGGLFARGIAKDAAQTQAEQTIANAEAEKMRATALVEAIRYQRDQMRGAAAFDSEVRRYAGMLIDAERSKAAPAEDWRAASPDVFTPAASGAGGGGGGFVWVE